MNGAPERGELFFQKDADGDGGCALWSLYLVDGRYGVAVLRRWTIDKHNPDWLDAWEFQGQHASREEAIALIEARGASGEQ